MAGTTRERRCIVTGEVGPAEARIRFVRDPEGHAVPDLAATLPGRGAWLSSERDAVRLAVKRRLFARAFKAPTEAAPELDDQIERLLARRCVDLVSLARKAGQAVAGFGKVEAMARAGRIGVLLTAIEGAEDGRRRLYGLAGAAARIGILHAAELGLAFGRENVVHAAMAPGRLADRLLLESRRLAGFRTVRDATSRPPALDESNCGEPTFGGPVAAQDSARDQQGRSPERRPAEFRR